jgi:protocatechuate 3,4-dioxygenase beta subunit
MTTRRLVLFSFLWLLGAGLAAAVVSPGVPVDGQVLDADGKPVQGASVRLVPRAKGHEIWTMHLENRANPEPVAKATSDAKGQFRVTAPETGMWRVIVEAPGRVPRQYDLEPLLEAASLPPVHLPADTGLEVRVTDPKGQPVAGAHVRVTAPAHPVRRGRRYGEFFPETWEAVTRTAVTGADGRAMLPGAKGERMTVSALVSGFPLAREAEASSSPVKLALQAGCERVLEVTAQSRPVAGAAAQVSGRAVALSGETGRLTVVVPCGKEVQVQVRTRDGHMATASISPITAGKEPASPLRVAFGAPPPPLAGRVVDAVSREPVAGAFVWGEDPAAFARTDARGAYTVAASDSLQAVSPEHMPASEAVQSAPGGGPAGPAFALVPVAVAEGAVVDAEGRPVPGVNLQAIPRPVTRVMYSMSIAELPQPALSDARGLFRFRLPSRIPYEITTQHEGYAPVSVKVPPLEPRSSRKDLRIVLERGRTAFGRVVDTREQPVAGARVSLQRAAGAEDDMEIMMWGGDDGSGFEGTTDAAGRFEIGRLPAGRFDLRARADGFAPMTVPGVVVEGKAAARVDLGTVVLPPGFNVEGTVVDPQGKPVEGAMVVAQPTDFLMMRTFSQVEEPPKTGPDGRFAIPGLREGQRIDVQAWKEGYLQGAAVAVDIPAPGPVRIVLEPGLRITGRVVAEDGKPVAEAAVYALSEESGTRMSRSRSGGGHTDETGRFTLEGLEPGKLLVQAAAPGYLAGETRVEAMAGAEPPEVRIVLRAGAVVTGRVLGPDGAPVPGADVRTVQTSREEAGFSFRMGGSARTDGEGRYRLESIEEGRRSIAASHPDFQRAVKDLDVRAGENRLDLQLDRGFPVTGRVVDSGGRPVADARVRLSSRGFGLGFGPEEMEEAASGADGAFQFPSVAPGTYGISASKEGYAPAVPPDPVQVAGAPVAGLELRLETGGILRGRVKGLGFEALANVNVFAVRADSLGIEAGMRHGGVDFEGVYTIEGVAPGDWMVMAMAGSASARGQVTLPEGAAEATLDLEFGGGFTLSGRVLRAGVPMPGLQVMASGKDAASHAMGSTGPQGEFRLEGLEAGRYTVGAMDFRKGLHHMEEVEVSGDQEIVIELPTRRVSGRVLDAADSSPIEGASVTLEKTGEDPGFGGSGASTDAGGAFTVNDVGEGTWRAVARKEGYAPGEATVEVGAGDVDGVRLALSPGAGLVLEVRTAAGGIPAAIFAGLLDAGNRIVLSGSYETGEGGRVSLRSAPPGRFRLYVSAAGAATASVDVTVPGEPIRLVLPPASQIVVTVPDLAAERGHGTLQLIGADGQPFRSVVYGMTLTEWPLQEGRTVVEAVPPGTWRLRVTAPDGRAWEGTATTAGGRTQVVLE